MIQHLFNSMGVTDWLLFGAIISSLVWQWLFFRMLAVNNKTAALNQKLLDQNHHLARDLRISQHRAHIYHLRLRERQGHDFGGRG